MAANDTAGAATVLGVLVTLFGWLPLTNQLKTLHSAIPAWAKRWSPKLAPLGRCSHDDQCPNCREGEPCLGEACGGLILRKAQGGRSSFYCAKCQT